MAAVNPPLYLDQDDAYGAADLGLPYRDILGEGVVGANDLLVTASAGLNSSVAAGAAWITGDTDVNAQPAYRVRNDAAVTLAHNAADATNPRIDLVIAEVLDATFSGISKLWRLRVVTGVPAGAPVAPALPDNAIKLAEVRINAGSGTLTSVTDKRTRAKVGGGAASSAAGAIVSGSKAADTTTAGTSFATGADLLAADLSFEADGVSSYLVEVTAVGWMNSVSTNQLAASLKLDGADGGIVAIATAPGALALTGPFFARAIITPAAGAHTVNLRFWGGANTTTIRAGAGGAGGLLPARIRVVKA